MYKRYITLLFYFLFFSLLVTPVFSVERLITLNETFESMSFFNLNRDAMDNISVEDTTTSNSFTADLGLYFVGFINSTSANQDTNITFSKFWEDGENIQSRMVTDILDQEILFFHFFDDPITLTNDTIINILANATDQSIVSIIFINTTNDCVFEFRAGDVTPVASNRYCGTVPFVCEYDLADRYFESGTPQNINFTLGNSGSDCVVTDGYPDFENINRIGVYAQDFVFGFQVVYIEHFSVENVLNGSNELPFFNITVDNNVGCINQSGDVGNISIDIVASDRENDTILYATEFTFSKNFNRSISYSKRECGFIDKIFLNCRNVKDLTFLSNAEFPTTDTCRINDKETINTSQFSLEEITDFTSPARFIFDNDLGFISVEDVFMLALTSTCTGTDQSYYYRLDNAITDVFYGTDIFRLFEEGEAFNFSFFDSLLSTEIIRLNFKILSGNLTISDYNGTDLNLIFSEDFDLNITNSFRFSTNWVSDQSTNLLILSTLANNRTEQVDFSVEFNTLNSDFLVKYFVFNVGNNTVFFQKDFIFSGLISTPVFSETPITNLSFNSFGVHHVSFFISDDEHDATEFKVEQEAFTIVECAKFTPGVRDLPGFPILTFLGDMKGVIKSICVPLDRAFITSIFGSQSDRFGVCFAIKGTYFFMGFIIAAMLGVAFKILLNGEIAYIVFQSVFFLVGLFGALLFDLKVFTIFYFILSGTSVILFILKTYVFGSGIGEDAD